MTALRLADRVETSRVKVTLQRGTSGAMALSFPLV
jgi:hypothetical protein